jgi:hypothetical protein
VSPSRNGSVTDRCAVCDGPLPAGRPRRTCSDACRQAAWRRRHAPAPPAVEALAPARPRKAGTVYECPTCETRLVGEQRCECGSFMRRLGPGGLSACCGEPMTVEELLAL